MFSEKRLKPQPLGWGWASSRQFFVILFWDSSTFTKRASLIILVGLFFIINL